MIGTGRANMNTARRAHMPPITFKKHFTTMASNNQASYLSRPCLRTLLSNTHSGEDHETPPETIRKRPLAVSVSLSKIHQTEIM